jgi:hypothetical protein
MIYNNVIQASEHERVNNMTVQELIDTLKELNPNATVCIELNYIPTGETIEIRNVDEIETINVVILGA